MKTCTRCNQIKPFSEFGVHKSQRDGLRCRCKLCEHEVDKIWRKNNPEKTKLKNARANAAERERRKNDPIYREVLREKDRIRHASRSPERLAQIAKINRKNVLRREYGLTFEQYERLLKSQKNRCAICEKTLVNRPQVDHDHKTGEVRGILCVRCNVLVGIIENEPPRIRQYINNPPARFIIPDAVSMPINGPRRALVRLLAGRAVNS